MTALLAPVALRWFLFDAPRSLIQGWATLLRFTLIYFSIGALLKTLFSPWKGIEWQKTTRGFDVGEYASRIFSNLISRILGAMVRIALIAAGIIAECLVFIAGIILLAAWFLLPVLIAASFFYGVILLF